MSAGSAAAPSTPAELARLAFGFAYTHVLRVALELGLPELLAEGPREPAELAAATETHLPSLSRLVRALVALGLVEERDGVLHLSELGQCLCREVPGSIRGVVELALDPVLSQAWTELTHTVRTGETAFDRVHGHGLFVLPVDLREPGALSAVMSDMQMLALTPGRERTLAEFSRVFADSGFALAQAYPLPERPEMHVLEARPV
ncbi:methyltransferase dimerization domain-containing protein [Crossiella sp. CA-258035]|uniref:methyltransferase family protein n=1 Tax=Crossiella sp. CA-258035 TaxID=2981138 RepID=UPI0024BD1670|nr:methyltransferase dimerization domain-containing protein [Crossiella sp. CA-258035]WHT17910.1 methyltransferase dimerization domain-containing protein [Crossiella sp. CA-258035]